MAELDWVKELISKLDIVSVISGYIGLTKKGANYWGNCPFHSEKTPSFCVNQLGQFYHCFGCGESGDVISFVEKIEGFSFIEACRLLAERCNYKLPEYSPGAVDTVSLRNKERLYKLMECTKNHYKKNLYSAPGEKALSYIRGRGLTDAQIADFDIGFADKGYVLVKHLQELGFTVEEMRECGIIELNENNSPYDSLYGRLIFPIINNYDQVIAFGGRSIVPTDFAKYKNTKETPLFSKRNTLYGINLLKKLKLKEQVKDIIIVEGYMDVIGLYRYGIKNVVAGMGTALTERQATMLSRLRPDTVYMCYDGDFAGQNATDRGMNILFAKDLNVRVIALPGGVDPDEYVRDNGAEAFNTLMKEALPLFDYKISQLKKKYALNTPEGKGKFALECLTELKIIDNLVQATPYLKEVSQLSDVPLETLTNQYAGEISEKALIPKPIKAPESNDTLYFKCLSFILYSIITRQGYYNKESLEDYIDAKYLPLYKEAVLAYADNTEYNAARFHNLIPTEDFVKIINLDDKFYIEREPTGEQLIGEDAKNARLMRQKRFDKENVMADYYVDCVTSLKRLYVEEKLKALTKRIESTEDKAEKLKLFKELSSLQAQYKSLLR